MCHLVVACLLVTLVTCVLALARELRRRRAHAKFLHFIRSQGVAHDPNLDSP
jgi:hypothetical protein